MEITASGNTNYENGIATAHGNVAIHTGDADIYADSALFRLALDQLNGIAEL